jgi:hypothetical protein
MPSRKITAAPVLHVLTTEEIQDPLLAIDRFFDMTNLEDGRALLWTWLKTTVAGNYNKTLDARERALILNFYENMEKLMEAAFVLH